MVQKYLIVNKWKEKKRKGKEKKTMKFVNFATLRFVRPVFFSFSFIFYCFVMLCFLFFSFSFIGGGWRGKEKKLSPNEFHQIDRSHLSSFVRVCSFRKEDRKSRSYRQMGLNRASSCEWTSRHDSSSISVFEICLPIRNSSYDWRGNSYVISTRRIGTCFRE